MFGPLPCPPSHSTVKLLAPLDRSHDARGGMGPMTEATILLHDETRALVRTVEVRARACARACVHETARTHARTRTQTHTERTQHAIGHGV